MDLELSHHSLTTGVDENNKAGGFSDEFSTALKVALLSQKHETLSPSSARGPG